MQSTNNRMAWDESASFSVLDLSFMDEKAARFEDSVWEEGSVGEIRERNSTMVRGSFREEDSFKEEDSSWASDMAKNQKFTSTPATFATFETEYQGFEIYDDFILSHETTFATFETKREISGNNRGKIGENGAALGKDREITAKNNVNSVASPVAEPASEHVVSPAVEQLAKSTAKQMARPTVKQAASPTTKQMAKNLAAFLGALVDIDDQMTEAANQQRNEEMAKEANNQVAEPVAKQVVSSAAEEIAEPAAEQVASPTTKQMDSPAPMVLCSGVLMVNEVTGKPLRCIYCGRWHHTDGSAWYIGECDLCGERKTNKNVCSLITAEWL